MKATSTPPSFGRAQREGRPLVRRGSLAVAALLLVACGPSGPRSSSSTHWLGCSVDAECVNLAPDARCAADGYCATSAGARLEQRLVLAQEFSESALDTTVFGYETGAGIRNGELQSYTARVENVRVEGGALVLTARAEALDGAAYTSGSVNTAGLFAFTFGRAEARIAAPAGRGCSTAFWMLPEAPGAAVNTCIDPNPCGASTWPAWGDMTVANLQSQAPNQAIGALNYGIWDAAAAGVTHGLFAGDVAAVADTAEWHTYALEWGPARIAWYVDDVEVRALALPPPDLYLPDGLDPFRQPFHLRLNLAIGGFDQAPVVADFPQELRVDWLRVWQWSAAD